MSRETNEELAACPLSAPLHPTVRVRVVVSSEVETLFERARNGSFAEKEAAYHFAKVYGYPKEREEFWAEIGNAIVNRCADTRDFGGTIGVLRCDRRSHEGNPWHVALSRGFRFSWDPNFHHQRPAEPDEEIP